MKIIIGEIYTSKESNLTQASGDKSAKSSGNVCKEKQNKINTFTASDTEQYFSGWLNLEKTYCIF